MGQYDGSWPWHDRQAGLFPPHRPQRSLGDIGLLARQMLGQHECIPRL